MKRMRHLNDMTTSGSILDDDRSNKDFTYSGILFFMDAVAIFAILGLNNLLIIYVYLQTSFIEILNVFPYLDLYHPLVMSHNEHIVQMNPGPTL